MRLLATEETCTPGTRYGTPRKARRSKPFSVANLLKFQVEFIIM